MKVKFIKICKASKQIVFFLWNLKEKTLLICLFTVCIVTIASDD
jgi:hypothetical protein